MPYRRPNTSGTQKKTAPTPRAYNGTPGAAAWASTGAMARSSAGTPCGPISQRAAARFLCSFGRRFLRWT